MKYLASIIFTIATLLIIIGIAKNMGDNPNSTIAGMGAMATNTYYHLATAMYAAAVAAQLMWGSINLQR